MEGSARVARSSLTELAVLAAIALALSGCAAVRPVDRLPGEQVAPESRRVFRDGMERLRAGEPEAARAAFDQAVELSPLFVEAHRQIQNLRLQGLEGEALLREYTELLDRHPKSGAAHYLYGRLLFDIEQQLSRFERAAELAPGLAWAHYGKAYAEARLGRADAAMASLSRAIRADPRHALAHVLRARVLIQGEDLASAQAELGRAIEIEPEEPESWRLLAHIASRRGRRLDEMRSLERALELDPGSAETVSRLAAIALEDPQGSAGFLAFDRLDALYSERPDDAELAAMLAAVNERWGETEAARQLAHRALELGCVRRDPVMVLRRIEGPAGFDAWSAYMEIGSESLSPPLRALRDSLGPHTAVRRGPRPETLDDPPDEGLEALMTAAGWHDAAMRLRPHGVTGRRHETSDPLRLHKRVVAKLQLLVRGMEAGRELASEDLEPFLNEVAEVIEETTGEDVSTGNEILSFPFIGEMLDVTEIQEGSINAYLRRFNQVLFAGRLAGGETQAILMTTVEGPRRVHPPGWPDDFGYIEVVGENVVIRPKDRLFGETAGRALFKTYFVDLDVLIPWKRALLKIRDTDPAVRERLLASHGLEARGSRDRKRIDLPLHASEALLLRCLELHGDLPVVQSVKVHEQGHLRDAHNYLPLWEKIFSNVLLALQGGFRSIGVMSYLEEAAELHALRFGPSPHFVLAEMVRALPNGLEPGPHALGYRRLLERFLIAMDARLDELPSIRKDRVLVHQLHHLSEEEIRSIAADL